MILFKMYLTNKNVDWSELRASIKVGCSHIWRIFSMILYVTHWGVWLVIASTIVSYAFLYATKWSTPWLPLGGSTLFELDYTIWMYPIPMANHNLWKTSTTTPLRPRPLPLAIVFKVTSNSIFVMACVKLHFMCSWILSFKILKKSFLIWIEFVPQASLNMEFWIKFSTSSSKSNLKGNNLPHFIL